MYVIKVDKNTSVEDLLEALKLIEVLGKEEVLRQKEKTEKEENRSPREKLVAKLEADLNVVPRTKRRKVKRLSWQRKKKNRAVIAKRYREGRRERVNKEWALKLIEGKPEDLYFWVSKRRGDARYKYQRPEWKISYEEFLEYVYPCLGEQIPLVRRYDAKSPWTLSNTVWLDKDDVKIVLFDGAEWDMRRRGYVAPL